MAAPAFVASPGYTYIGANTTAPSGSRLYTGETLTACAATDTVGTTLNAATFGGVDILPYLVATVVDTYRVWSWVIPPSALSSLTPGNTYTFTLTFSGTTSTGIGIVEYSGVLGYDVQEELYESTGSTIVDVLDLPAESTTIQYVIWAASATNIVPNSSQNERDDRGGGTRRRAWYDYSTEVEQLGHTLQLTQVSGAHAHVTLTLLGAPPAEDGEADPVVADDSTTGTPMSPLASPLLSAAAALALTISAIAQPAIAVESSIATTVAAVASFAAADDAQTANPIGPRAQADVADGALAGAPIGPTAGSTDSDDAVTNEPVVEIAAVASPVLAGDSTTGSVTSGIASGAVAAEAQAFVALSVTAGHALADDASTNEPEAVFVGEPLPLVGGASVVSAGLSVVASPDNSSGSISGQPIAAIAATVVADDSEATAGAPRPEDKTVRLTWSHQPAAGIELTTHTPGRSATYTWSPTQ